MNKTIAVFSMAVILCFSLSSCASTGEKLSERGRVKQNEQSAQSTKIERISASDMPDGFASVGFSSAKINFAEKTTVSTKAELLAALKKGGVIFVNGMIDLSDGMLSDERGGSTLALDDFVRKNSDFSSYAEYKAAYAAACTIGTEDSNNKSPQSALYGTMHNLNLLYKDVITLAVQSDTYLIGLGERSGFSGGSVLVKDAKNVVIRNLFVQDAYDPFPHHEAGDGYNAQHDAISVQNSSNVWIDHCTLCDTKGISHVLTSGSIEEKWQTYDGLCDITKGCDNITVSFCKFMNHDKTMLIGSSDSEAISAENRHITLHHNYFYNCGQRLPMVRLSTVHSYNNLFETDESAPYKSNYALGVRNAALIQSQANYYGKGTLYSFSGHSSKQGTVYSIGDIDQSVNGKKDGQFKISAEPLFEIPYEFTVLEAEKVMDFDKANAGAGVLILEQ